MASRAHRIIAALVVMALSLAAIADTAAATNNAKSGTHTGNPKSKSTTRG